jgi:cytochrome P450
LRRRPVDPVTIIDESVRMNLTVSEVASLLADPLAYTDEVRLHAGLALLREQCPVVRVEQSPYRPFWAITKHADILDIERNNVLWINEPRPALRLPELDDRLRTMLADGVEVRALVETDGERHRRARAVGIEWFRPKAMRALKRQVDDLAKRYVDHMAQIGPQCDFAADVATAYPGDVIFSLLGVPEDDVPMLLRWTQEAFGHDDGELQRDSSPEGYFEVVADFFDYFRTVTNERRRHPTGDLSSAIANARIEGELMSDDDTLNYYATFAAAGHDTTKAAIAGGLLALIEHPDERQRLAGDLSLMPTAVEEMIRWSTPVKEFMRTAVADTTVRGVPIGAGVHFCLGAALARLEIDSFFTELLPRLRSIELAGDPKFIATTLIGGLKQLPIRYELI